MYKNLTNFNFHLTELSEQLFKCFSPAPRNRRPRPGGNPAPARNNFDPPNQNNIQRRRDRGRGRGQRNNIAWQNNRAITVGETGVIYDGHENGNIHVLPVPEGQQHQPPNPALPPQVQLPLLPVQQPPQYAENLFGFESSSSESSAHGDVRPFHSGYSPDGRSESD